MTLFVFSTGVTSGATEGAEACPIFVGMSSKSAMFLQVIKQWDECLSIIASLCHSNGGRLYTESVDVKSKKMGVALQCD